MKDLSGEEGATRRGRTSRDYLGLIEAAYKVEQSEADWLRAISDAAREVLDRGLGVLALTFDASAPQRLRLSPVAGGDSSLFDPRILRRDSLSMGRNPSFTRAYYWGGRPVAQASEFGPIPHVPYFASAGVVDILSLRTLDPSHRGMLMAIPLPRPIRLSPRTRGTLSCVAAHLGAAFRLRELARVGLDDSDAVFGQRGNLEHVAPDIRGSTRIPALKAGVVNLLQSRKLRRESPERAVELWRALIAGRWSVFDRIDTDGRRFVVARRNELNMADPRALSEDERRVALYASWGHSLKLIAYEVGLAESTVSYHLKRALRKLGLRSRSEIAGLFDQEPTPREQEDRRLPQSKRES